MEYNAIKVKVVREVCFIEFNRPDAKNTINEQMIDEMNQVFDLYENECKIIVFQGNKEFFCFGADFNVISDEAVQDNPKEQNPGKLYDVWNRMIKSSCITIAHVQGAVNAGGMGFVSACDIVIASENAKFSLSELIFGLMPAMVIPFAIRKIGFGKVNYLALTTKSIDAKTAYDWGLADVVSENSDSCLRQHIARMAHVPKDGIARYKRYVSSIAEIPKEFRQKAIEANLEVFSEKTNLERIYNFTQNGIYPWER